MSTALDLLPDPDVVGAEEYRLVHDYVTELEGQDTDPVIIQAGLDELSRWARRALIEYTRMTNTF